MAVAPLPTTATRLPAKSSGSCGHWDAWNDLPSKLAIPSKFGNVGVDNTPIPEITKRSYVTTVGQMNRPNVCLIVEHHRFDPAVKLHVFAQIEFIGHKVQVLQCLRLG